VECEPASGALVRQLNVLQAGPGRVTDDIPFTNDGFGIDSIRLAQPAACP
jgi:hypothetical protein